MNNEKPEILFNKFTIHLAILFGALTMSRHVGLKFELFQHGCVKSILPYMEDFRMGLLLKVGQVRRSEFNFSAPEMVF